MWHPKRQQVVNEGHMHDWLEYRLWSATNLAVASPVHIADLAHSKYPVLHQTEQGKLLWHVEGILKSVEGEHKVEHDNEKYDHN